MTQKKVALVTGSNRGIGLEIVRQLADKGYTTILSSRNPDSGQEALNKIKQANYDLHFHQLDVQGPESINQIKNYIEKTFGRLDILINNAGINYDTWHNVANADLDQVSTTFDVNLMGPWRMAQAFIPMMKQQGYGRIVNVSSQSGAIKSQMGNTPGYSLSKAALNLLTVQLANHLQETGILVNSVCPGWVRTEMGGPNAPRSVEQGASGIVWLAELAGDGPSGKFFTDKKEISL